MGDSKEGKGLCVCGYWKPLSLLQLQPLPWRDESLLRELALLKVEIKSLCVHSDPLCPGERECSLFPSLKEQTPPFMSPFMAQGGQPCLSGSVWLYRLHWYLAPAPAAGLAKNSLGESSVRKKSNCIEGFYLFSRAELMLNFSLSPSDVNHRVLCVNAAKPLGALSSWFLPSCVPASSR